MGIQFQLSISRKKHFKMGIVLVVAFLALAAAAPPQATGTADCVFPFVYKDFTYNAPTTANTDPPRWWCAINIKPGEQYKVDNCVYKDVTYAGCTDVNHPSCWCSFSGKYVTGGWG